MAAYDIRFAAAIMVAALAAAALSACGADSAAPTVPPHTSTTTARSGSFAWFAAGSAPAGWHQAELPDQAATLSYPPTAKPARADVGSLAYATVQSDGQYLLYLNATPRQGAESLTNWTQLRIEHVADDDAATVTLDAAATHLPFTGGTGSCVLDHYTTRIGAHHYREISCFVLGASGGSVLVAATPEDTWSSARSTLEQVVDSYSAH